MTILSMSQNRVPGTFFTSIPFSLLFIIGFFLIFIGNSIDSKLLIISGFVSIFLGIIFQMRTHVYATRFLNLRH